MLLSLNKINFKTFLINLLFSLIPISFIAGNLILNVNILLFIIFTIAFHGKDMFSINFNNLDKAILIFFAYTIFTGIFNNFFFQKPKSFPEDYTIIIKTILYLRFLFFYFAIRFLIYKNLINFKLFFIFCTLCVYFVCLDLIYQFNFGKDIFGYVSTDLRRLSGPFGGNELIAGSYLQRFSLFSFFLILFFFNNKNKAQLFLILLISFILIIFSLIIAGNRMPLILFIILITCVFSFYKPTRKYLLLFLLSSTVIFIILLNVNQNIKNHFGSLKLRVTGFADFVYAVVIKDEKTKSIENKDNVYMLKSQGVKIEEWYKYSINVNGKTIPLTTLHIKEFNSGYQTWLEYKYFGGGIKSFRSNCVTHNCNTHPHNYYLEILSELGLIGFILLIVIFFKVFYESFFKKYIIRPNVPYDQRIIPFVFLFLIEIFPIKSTGSFFTTGNATYIFLIMSVTIALSQTSERKI